MLNKQYYVEKAKVEKLIARKNQKTDFYNGIYDRYEYPVLTREFAPVEWRYDLNPKTNPNFQERLGINAVMNSGAIELNGKYYLVVRVEGNDRKSFFAVAESDTGIDGFHFWDYPVQLPDTCPEETNVYDMRLTKHEDGWIYGVFCSESKDKTNPDLSAAVAEAGIVRTKDLKTWERLDNLKTLHSPQQRNVVLHPEFVDGKYAFYTRPMDGFIETGSGGGIGFGLCDDIEHAVIDEEKIISRRIYHTLTESKNGAGAVPIRGKKCWINIAHGVRNTAAGLRYVLYVFGTDLNDPSKVIAEPSGVFLVPLGKERVGDVSNVVFTNGAIAKDNGDVYIYYASCDTRMHVATTTIDKLEDYLFHTPRDPHRSPDCVKQRCELIMNNTYQRWCEDEYFDADTRAELKAIADDPQEIKERFYKDLEFGTGGLRGILGAGTNRMNIYTVRKATQGLANFIIKENAQAKGVAIAFDSRHMSPEFAKETALCMAANGIKAYIFPSLRPTPMLSFALRELGCTAGVVVTASHNPPQYNGYKVYWEDGAQITAPKDKQIITEVQAITDFAQVKTMSEEDAKAAGLYEVIGEEIDDKYMEALKKLVLRPEAIKEQADKLKIVYTPLHGTGNIPVRRVLKELGFNNVYVVKEQELPDGDFSTVSYPNPEDKNAFTLALKLAAEVDADIVLATDPDADRLGIYAKNEKTGEYESFTGNMSGMLILEYLLSQRKELGMLPENGAVVTTIVSGKMARAIAKEYNVELIETLTGFKYIGEQIKFFEQNHDHEFLFGYEESYGCLEGTHARDKDAVVAVMALCEAAAYYKSKGITLCEQMQNLYQKYGFYKESLFFQTFQGMEGKAKIDGLMDALRNEPPKQVGPFKVTALEDYKKSIRTDIATGETSALTLPESNVLYFELEGGAWFCVRPSGTEPKIKYYAGVKGADTQDATDKLEALSKAVVEL